MSFAKEQVRLVFDAIYDRLAARAADIHRMLCTESSFEVWCSWEAFLACTVRWPGWKLQAHPYYVDHGAPVCDASETGDLGVCVDYANDSGWLFGEFALLHDFTTSKGMWEKVDGDRRKLLRIPYVDDALALFVISASRGNIRDRATWRAYAEQAATIPVRSKDEREFPLSPAGHLVLQVFDLAKPTAP